MFLSVEKAVAAPAGAATLKVRARPARSKSIEQNRAEREGAFLRLIAAMCRGLRFRELTDQVQRFGQRMIDAEHDGLVLLDEVRVDRIVGSAVEIAPAPAHAELRTHIRDLVARLNIVAVRVARVAAGVEGVQQEAGRADTAAGVVVRNGFESRHIDLAADVESGRVLTVEHGALGVQRLPDSARPDLAAHAAFPGVAQLALEAVGVGTLLESAGSHAGR